MRVAIETSCAQRPGFDRGIGRYVAAVKSANDLLGNTTQDVTSPIPRGRAGEVLALPGRIRRLAAARYDVFHALTPYYFSPDVRRRPSVATILDTIPLDLRGHRRTGAKARLFYHLSARADVVITLSHHAATRIHSLLGVAAERLVVAPLPPDDVFTVLGNVESAFARPYVVAMLDLRTPDPRKRAGLLVRVAAALTEWDIPIVLAGSGTDTVQFPGIIGLGRVSDEQWAALLRGALVLLYTSAYEGQGMPPTEAIACGCPVVGVSNTAIPEVVGDAGILVEERPQREERELAEDLAASVVRIAQSATLEETLKSMCAAQAEKFTMQSFCAQLAAAYSLADRRHSAG